MKYTLIFLDMVPLEENESQLPAVELLEIARQRVWNTDAVVNRVTVEPSGVCLEVEAEFYVECEPSGLPKIVAQVLFRRHTLHGAGREGYGSQPAPKLCLEL